MANNCVFDLIIHSVLSYCVAHFSLTLIISLYLSLFHARSLSLSHALSLSRFLSNTLSHSLSLFLSLNHSLSLTLSFSSKCIYAYTLWLITSLLSSMQYYSQLNENDSNQFAGRKLNAFTVCNKWLTRYEKFDQTRP